jgi:hypothetical protein
MNAILTLTTAMSTPPALAQMDHSTAIVTLVTTETALLVSTTSMPPAPTMPGPLTVLAITDKRWRCYLYRQRMYSRHQRL